MQPFDGKSGMETVQYIETGHRLVHHHRDGPDIRYALDTVSGEIFGRAKTPDIWQILYFFHA